MVTPGYGNRDGSWETMWLGLSYHLDPGLGFGSEFIHTCYPVVYPPAYMYVKADHARTHDKSVPY